jgi:hypothetical protein
MSAITFDQYDSSVELLGTAGFAGYGCRRFAGQKQSTISNQDFGREELHRYTCSA